MFIKYVYRNVKVKMSSLSGIKLRPFTKLGSYSRHFAITKK